MATPKKIQVKSFTEPEATLAELSNEEVRAINFAQAREDAIANSEKDAENRVLNIIDTPAVQAEPETVEQTEARLAAEAEEVL